MIRQRTFTGETTVLYYVPEKKELGITRLNRDWKKKMAKNNFEDSKEFSKKMTLDFIKDLKENRTEIIKTLENDRRFMREEFKKEREENQKKFEKAFLEIREIKTELKIFKWILSGVGVAVIAGIVDKVMR
jgi:hypothetical protein